MTDDDHNTIDPLPLDPDERAAIDAVADLLSGEAVWREPDAELGDHVLAAIAEERGAAASSTPINLGARRRLRSRVALAVGAAAAILVVVALAVAVRGESSGEQFALAGTDLAPGASAEVTATAAPSGERLDLRTEGLGAAEPGSYYQGWVRSEDGDLVPIGTFHLRGGDGEIELWSGVDPEEYPIITVTLQEEGAGPESSGQVVLRGRLDR